MKPTLDQVTEAVHIIADSIREDDDLTEGDIFLFIEETLGDIGFYPQIEFLEELTKKFSMNENIPEIISDIMWEIDLND